MSKNKDYTKYSRENKTANVTNASTEEVVEVKDDIVAEEVIVEPAAVEEVVNESKHIEPLPHKSGHVTECIKLNVRKNPSPNAEVIGTVNRGDSLIIDPSPFGDFYKVITPYGVEGYCMKKFVYIND